MVLDHCTLLSMKLVDEERKRSERLDVHCKLASFDLFFLFID